MPRTVRIRTRKIATDSPQVIWDTDINIIRNLDEDLVREDDPVDRGHQAIPEARSATLQSSETHQTRNIVSHNNMRSSASKTSKKWPARLFSMLCCIVILSVVAFLLAFVYVFLKGKRINIRPTISQYISLHSGRWRYRMVYNEITTTVEKLFTPLIIT
ncbi:UNVERIFIED_CONTAM: hypothetical protein FKN15_001343 [Acipenser sinensis]